MKKIAVNTVLAASILAGTACSNSDDSDTSGERGAAVFLNAVPDAGLMHFSGERLFGSSDYGATTPPISGLDARSWEVSPARYISDTNTESLLDGIISVDADKIKLHVVTGTIEQDNLALVSIPVAEDEDQNDDIITFNVAQLNASSEDVDVYFLKETETLEGASPLLSLSPMEVSNDVELEEARYEVVVTIKGDSNQVVYNSALREFLDLSEQSIVLIPGRENTSACPDSSDEGLPLFSGIYFASGSSLVLDNSSGESCVRVLNAIQNDDPTINQVRLSETQLIDENSELVFGQYSDPIFVNSGTFQFTSNLDQGQWLKSVSLASGASETLVVTGCTDYGDSYKIYNISDDSAPIADQSRITVSHFGYILDEENESFDIHIISASQSLPNFSLLIPSISNLNFGKSDDFRFYFTEGNYKVYAVNRSDGQYLQPETINISGGENVQLILIHDGDTYELKNISSN